MGSNSLLERLEAKRIAETIKPSELLGLHRPINAYPEDHNGYPHRKRFQNAISDWYAIPLTLRERTMLAFMGEITDKPAWAKKIYDEEILAKWRLEREQKEKSSEPEKALTEKMFDYCLEELRDYAQYQEDNGFVPAIDADAAVYKSDSIIPEAAKEKLKAAVAPLEDVPAKQQDWHPGSDDKVLDLVHPSLFPLLYGRSRVLTDGVVPLEDCELHVGKGEVIATPEAAHLELKRYAGLSHWRGHHRPNWYSSRFQWLPCEIKFGENETIKITSYINNLQPKNNKPLYEAIEDILSKVIPMWDKTLSSTERTGYPATSRIDIDEAEWIETDLVREPEPDEDEYTDDDEIFQADEAFRKANRKLVMPEPGEYAEFKAAREAKEKEKEEDSQLVNLRKDWADQGLQVIVKLANIHLTPEKPTYDGGSWHIEGQLNEHIVASAIYYYDSSNITPSYLAFREATAVDHLSDKPYEQDDYEHFERLYDIKQHAPAVQTLGRVLTPENRVLTFPNVLHHQVSPFKLADPSQPGHRKILALFLVDPYLRIPSTANVPPQQREWWRNVVQSLDRVDQLPPELADHVVDSAGDFPLELQEAKAIREELMEERKMFGADVDTRLQEENFNFCEH